ncbi:MAG: immunoglobulin domain-containing protein, partial [Verrucomicrobiota bacterium]
FQFPNMTRMTYTPASGSYLVQNVAQIYINFTSNTVNGNTGENGYQGYSEIAIYGTPSAAAVFPPTVTTNTLPSVCQDVVGSSETFIAGFISSSPMTYQWMVDTGTGPQPVTGANFSGMTTPVLTDKNLQLGDSGSYSCVATVASGPAAGSATSAPNTFTVNPAPTPVGNIIISDALQAWSNSTFAPAFTPTWTVQPGSFFAGTLPTSCALRRNGSFSEDGQGNSGNGGGGLPVLTDGFPGTYGDNTDVTLATCGSTMGSNLIYTLGGPSGAYNISSIVTYGGWANNGRDEQAYTVYYSTVAAPATYINLTANDYKVASILTGASGWNNYPDCSRSTITAVSGVLATNVYAIGFNFVTPNGENNWEGYAEIQVFGTVAAWPRLSAPSFSGGNLILSGTGGTPGGGYTCLTTTNVAAPLSAWTTNSQGTCNGSGAFSLSIPVVTNPPAQFFQIRMP